MKRRLARLAAWGVAIALLAYILTKVDLRAVVSAARDAAPWTIPALVGLTLLIYLADAVAIWRTFGWFVAPLRFREVLAVRGATYMLAMVNYAIGQGAIVYFVNRSRKVPVARGAAAVLLIMGINLLLLLLMATAGLAFADNIPRLLKPVILLAYIGLGLYLVTVALKPRWLRSRPLFDVLLEAGLSGHAKALLVRIPHIVTLVVFTFVSLRAFGIAVPFEQAVLCLPIVYFVAVLPISPQGLGTSQLMMLTFFTAYAPGPDEASKAAVVVASSIGSQAIATAVQLLIGMACMRTAAARKLQDAPAAPMQEASA